MSSNTVPKFFIQTLLDGSVIAKKLAPESVVTTKIKDKNVTPAKLATGVDWDLTGSTLSVATPTLPAHATTKAYVDTAIETSTASWKHAVRVATAGTALSASYTFDTTADNGTFTRTAFGPIQIDGVTLAVGDRVLVKDEGGANQPRNGIYVVETAGDGVTQGVIHRSPDCDSSANFTPGFSVFVNEGATNADTVYGNATDGPIVVNTTPITMVQQAHISELTAGDGLTKTANTISVDNSATGGLDFNGSAQLQVKIGDNTLQTAAAGLQVKPNNGLEDDGTGLSVKIGSNLGLGFTGTSLHCLAGDGIQFGGTGGIEVRAATNGGLAVAAGGVSVTAADGLATSATGVAVDLATGVDPGLEFNANQLKAKVNTAAGLTITANGIECKLGSGMSFDGSGNLVASGGGGSVSGGAGIDVTAGVASVDLYTAGLSGLETTPAGASGKLRLDPNNIPTHTVKHQSATGATAPTMINLYHDATTPANYTGGVVTWSADNSAGTSLSTAMIKSSMTDITAGVEKGELQLYTLAAGGMLSALYIDDNQRLGVGSDSSGPVFPSAGPNRLNVLDSNLAHTGTQSHALSLIKNSTGSVGSGFGTGLDVHLENAGGAVVQAGSLMVTYDDSTAANEDAHMVFALRKAGIVTRSLKVDPFQVRHYAGVRHARTTVSAGAHAVTLDQYIIGCDSSAGVITLNLPSAVDAGEGAVYVIKDEAGSAGTNAITIDPSGTEPIDGSPTAALASDRAGVTIYSSGSATDGWFII